MLLLQLARSITGTKTALSLERRRAVADEPADRETHADSPSQYLAPHGTVRRPAPRITNADT